MLVISRTTYWKVSPEEVLPFGIGESTWYLGGEDGAGTGDGAVGAGDGAGVGVEGGLTFGGSDGGVYVGYLGELLDE
jgi:hypothetical protein